MYSSQKEELLITSSTCIAQVKDIYGGAYDTLKLPGDLTASSFGKTVRSPRDEHHGLY